MLYKLFKDTHKEYSKDKYEKDHKEKEYFKDYKDFHKEYEVFQQAVQGPDPALAAAAPATAPELAKHPEKYTLPDKHFKVEYEKFHKAEKVEFREYLPTIPTFDPGGPVEERLAALEAAMAQLTHFIPQELRPDLSKGALKQEPPAPAAKPTEEKK